MENVANNEPLSVKARNKIAATYGLMLGIVFVILTTVSYMLMSNMMMFYVTSVFSLIIATVLIGIFVKMVRKANGGYLEFREAFGAAFVMLLVACLISYLYNILYIHVIDPDMMMKMKESSLRMMEGMNVPDEALDKAAADFDKRIEDSKNFNIGSALMGYFGPVLLYGIFALIPCAIVKKPRPVFDHA